MDDLDDWQVGTKGDRYLYAILDEYGKCWVITDGDTRKVDGLPSLMRQGWRPLRETPFVSNKMSNNYILIYLERA